MIGASLLSLLFAGAALLNCIMLVTSDIATDDVIRQRQIDRLMGAIAARAEIESDVDIMECARACDALCNARIEPSGPLGTRRIVDGPLNAFNVYPARGHSAR